MFFCQTRQWIADTRFAELYLTVPWNTGMSRVFNPVRLGTVEICTYLLGMTCKMQSMSSKRAVSINHSMWNCTKGSCSLSWAPVSVSNGNALLQRSWRPYLVYSRVTSLSDWFIPSFLLTEGIYIKETSLDKDYHHYLGPSPFGMVTFFRGLRLTLFKLLGAHFEPQKKITEERNNHSANRNSHVCQRAFISHYQHDHEAASSKWPFDSPNGGHLSPEKVTFGSKHGSLWKTWKYLNIFKPRFCLSNFVQFSDI